MSEHEHSKTIYSDGKSITETWPCGCTCGGCRSDAPQAESEQVMNFIFKTTGDMELARTADLLVHMAQSVDVVDAKAIGLINSLDRLADASAKVRDILGDGSV